MEHYLFCIFIHIISNMYKSKEATVFRNYSIFLVIGEYAQNCVYLLITLFVFDYK